jgi:hypothetical protein
MAREFLSINEYLDIIGWTKPKLADELDVGLRIILRWANGQNETPLTVLEWLDALANAHLAYPKPVGWGEATGEPAVHDLTLKVCSRG